MASEDGQSRGTSLWAHGWGEKEQLTPEMNSPHPPWGAGMETPVLPNHPPPRFASAPTAAEPCPGLVPRCSKAGRKPEAAAVGRKPCAAASQFRGTGVSAETVAGASAHAPQHPMLPIGAWLTAHSIWEEPKYGNEGEVLGEKQACLMFNELPKNSLHKTPSRSVSYGCGQ